VDRKYQDPDTDYAGPDGNEFNGVAEVSFRDLQDKEERTSESRLEGRRIRVESF
jgi:hypothetical protein